MSTAIVRYGHGMLPEHPQMRCVDCNRWSYMAYRPEGFAGRCFGCLDAGPAENGRSTDA